MTRAELAIFARRKAEDATRSATNRRQAAEAWAGAPGLTLPQREVRAGVEHRLAATWAHEAAVFTAIAVALEEAPTR